MKGYLGDVLHDGHLTRLPRAWPEPEALKRTVAAIAGDGSKTITAEETARLQARVADRIRLDGAQSLSKRDLREACKVFLHPPAPFASTANGDELLGEVMRRRYRSGALALMDAYLDGFRETDEAILALAKALRALFTELFWSSHDPWQQRINDFALLTPTEVPHRLAETILASSNSPRACLEQTGLYTEGRLRGGLAEAAFREASRKVATETGASAKPLQERLLEWVQTQSCFPFPSALPEFALALLMPWSKGEPDAAHRARIIESLESAGGGDPRLKPGGRWGTVQQNAPEAYAILLGWLTRASVRQFLDIVGRSIHDSAGRTMWAYRRAFWTSYLLGEDGAPVIEQAWVAFGEDGAHLARQAARTSGDVSFSQFGRQTEKSSSHAALIMVIGETLVVDWSHNGKYNVWKRGTSKRPPLYLPRYGYGELNDGPHKDSHVGAAYYTWQKRLAELIEGRRFYTERPSWRPKGA